MPLIPLIRLVFGLASLAILYAAGYALVTWWQGEPVIDADGVVRWLREDWRLWAGLGLLAWSLLGRWIVLFLVARPDRDPTRAVRADGRMVEGHDGTRLYVEEQGFGTGPLVVLTHGWGLDSTIWNYARRDLSRYNLLTWDLPGLGRSRLKGALSLDVLAENLRSVIALAGDRPVVLVGHSIGGMTIQTLARNHPGMFGREVRGVVLLNTTYTNPLRTMILSPLMLALRRPLIEPLMRLAQWLQPLAWAGAWQGYLSGSAHLANRIGFGRFVTRSQLDHNTLLATRNPPSVLGKGNLAMFRWDAEPALPALTVPTLVIGGALDIVTKLEASEHIAGRAPGAAMTSVEGVNHMGFLERADVYNPMIAEFIDGLGLGDRPEASAANSAPADRDEDAALAG